MIARLFRVSAWLASALAMAGFALLVARGILAPQPVDATERGLLELAQRMVAHGQIYVEPTIAGVPGLLPGFPLVASIVMGMLGPNLLWLRLISVISITGVAALIMTVVHEETHNRTLAVASGSIMLAGYVLLAGNPSGARSEPLMLLLALGGGRAMRSLPGTAGGLLAALLLSVACFTHTQGLWLVGAALVYLTREDRGRLVPFTLGVAVLLAGGFVMLSKFLGPWFNHSVWDVPLQSLRFDGPALLRFVGGQLLGTLGVLTVMSVLSFVLPTRPWRGAGGIWPCIGLAAIGASLLATQSANPEPQALAMCVVALAVVGPISMHRVTQHLSAWPDSTRLAGEGAAMVALVLQFVALLAHIPPGLLFPKA